MTLKIYLFMKRLLIFKILLTGVFLFLGSEISAQKLICRDGQVKFLASVPSAVEEVSAVNNSSSAILDEKIGEFATQVLIKGFGFKVPLMEEHFNENYLESDKFPKAIFKGKIINFDANKLSASKANYLVEGDFILHGVTKHLKLPAVISKVGNKILVVSSFTLKAQDFNIKIPSLVKQKVADEIKVWTNFNF